MEVFHDLSKTNFSCEVVGLIVGNSNRDGVYVPRLLLGRGEELFTCGSAHVWPRRWEFLEVGLRCVMSRPQGKALVGNREYWAHTRPLELPLIPVVQSGPETTGQDSKKSVVVGICKVLATMSFITKADMMEGMFAAAVLEDTICGDRVKRSVDGKDERDGHKRRSATAMSVQHRYYWACRQL